MHREGIFRNSSLRAAARWTTAMILLCAVGCVTATHHSGRQIDDMKVHQIVKGQTTVDDVIAMFGAPQAQSEMGGNILYTYRYVESKSKTWFAPYSGGTHGEDTSDELTISFDKATGTVKTYSFQKGIKS